MRFILNLQSSRNVYFNYIKVLNKEEIQKVKIKGKPYLESGEICFMKKDFVLLKLFRNNICNIISTMNFENHPILNQIYDILTELHNQWKLIKFKHTKELKETKKQAKQQKQAHAYTVVFKIIQPPPCVFPMISIVNKSCNIECCVNNMFRINKKIIVSRGLELILSVFRRTTISDQHPLI